MSRSARLFDLAHLLAGRRPRPLREIAERFDISERTAYRDLSELGCMLPLMREEAGYRLLETASLRPLNLTAEEHALLRLALENPSLKRQPSLRSTLETLRAKLDAAARSAADAPLTLELAGPNRSGELAPGILEALQSALRAGLEVEILYTSLSTGDETWRRVDSLRLFEREGAWYLAAHCHRHGDVRLFRLDRVKAARPGACPARHAATDFDLDAFLATSWSLWVGPALHDIHLLCHPSLAPLLENARHHPGERLERHTDGLHYYVSLSSLDEIARWILGFGGRIEILAPDALRENVAVLAEGALERCATAVP